MPRARQCEELIDQFTADGGLADEMPPQPFPDAQAMDVSDHIYEPHGWGRLLWLIPLSPYLLVVGWIVMSFPGRPVRPTRRKLTIEEQAVQRNNAAHALHAQGKHEAAIEEYTRAIKLNPQLTVAWYNRAQLYLVAGRLAEALSDFDAAVRLAPHFHGALVMRGLLHYLLLAIARKRRVGLRKLRFRWRRLRRR